MGQVAEVLVTGPSRRGGRQFSGRDLWHRVVNFEVPEGEGIAPGSLRPVTLVAASPHSLVGVLDDARPARPAGEAIPILDARP